MGALILLGQSQRSADAVEAPEVDRARLQAHFETVEVELRTRDVSDLSPALRAERSRNIERLHDYAARGQFPRNSDFAGERVPYFIDDDGTACAVGQLMIDSGHRELAEQIASTENNAYVPDIQTPAATEWIAQSGLSVEECARIQPTYCFTCEDLDEDPVCGENGKTYENACTAIECAGVQVDYEGPCEDEDEDGATGRGCTCNATGGDTTPWWALLPVGVWIWRRR